MKYTKVLCLLIGRCIFASCRDCTPTPPPPATIKYQFRVLFVDPDGYTVKGFYDADGDGYRHYYVTRADSETSSMGADHRTTGKVRWTVPDEISTATINHAETMPATMPVER